MPICEEAVRAPEKRREPSEVQWRLPGCSWKSSQRGLLAVNFQSPDAFGQSELARRNSGSPLLAVPPEARMRAEPQCAWPLSGSIRNRGHLSTCEETGCSKRQH